MRERDFCCLEQKGSFLLLVFSSIFPFRRSSVFIVPSPFPLPALAFPQAEFRNSISNPFENHENLVLIQLMTLKGLGTEI